MAQIREIKSRIVSVKKTKQITSAMKMIAGVKMRKAEQRLRQVKPFAQLVDQLAFSVGQRNNALKNPFYKKSDFSKGKDLVIIIAGDRGLCGNYNGSVLRKSAEVCNEKSSDVLLFGRKAKAAYDKKKHPIKAHHENDPNKYADDFFETLSQSIMALYPDYDRVKVVYTQYVNAVKRDVMVKQLLPVFEGNQEERQPMEVDYIYEMTEEEVLDELMHTYLQSSLRYCLAESMASEESARMTAMDSATTNANTMIRQLTLLYNRVRQAGITTEIIEISSGAEALKAQA